MRSDAPSGGLRLRIDRAALAANWRALDRMSGSARAGAAVKADCYGLGVEHCVPALRDAGAGDFFVAHWGEVAAVARHVDPGRVAVLHGPLTAADCAYARTSGARPVINSLFQARLWLGSGGGPCHLMIDTGINRLGIAPGEAGDDAIAALQIDSVMSHLACADEDSDLNARQFALFRQVAAQFPGKPLSLANSAGIALGSEYRFDLTRPGLAIYGGIPRPELAHVIRQVAWPEAAILQIRQLTAGDRVGYNGEYTAPAQMRVGVVELGYADGFLRQWQPGAALRHGEARLPVLGKISMDMAVIDLAAAPDLKDGDHVALPYDLPTAAQQTGLSQYELLTVLGSRWDRHAD